MTAHSREASGSFFIYWTQYSVQTGRETFSTETHPWRQQETFPPLAWMMHGIFWGFVVIRIKLLNDNLPLNFQYFRTRRYLRDDLTPPIWPVKKSRPRYLSDILDYTWGKARWELCVMSYNIINLSVQFSSVAQSCPTLCNPMNCSTPGLPVHHQLPEFTQTQRPSSRWCHPAISSSVIPFSSYPQSLPASTWEWVKSSHEVAKVLEFQL